MLGVVVVTYRSEAYIRTCLGSVFRELQDTGEDYCLVLIDNNGQDRSVEIAREVFEPIRVIQNDENVGFAKAANQGIRKCLAEGCTEVMLINPDTEMEEGSLILMLRALRGDLQDREDRKEEGISHRIDHIDPLDPLDLPVGVVQPLITLMSDPGLVNTSGNVDRGMGFVGVGGYKRKIENVKRKNIEYASGACMVVRREVFEEVGLFDERFFLYFEDTEFSDRVRKAGWGIQLVPEARVCHDYRPVRSLRKMGNVMRSWWRWVFIKK